MKPARTLIVCAAAAFLALPAPGPLLGGDYTFFIRQIQLPDELEWDVSVAQEGSQPSALAINPNGARFELHAVKSSPLTGYLLDTTYVNSYIPVATVDITSEDPYSVIPRTRADRPFIVTFNVGGLTFDPDAPAAAKSVKLLRHVQAYPGKGVGDDINRNNATLHAQGSLSENGPYALEFALTSIPGADRLKVRGEERFSVYSLEDFGVPESQLSSKFIQIWPVATSVISGMEHGDQIKGVAPEVTVELEDLYPNSWTYAQVYQGPPQLGTAGKLVPGASIIIDGSVPRDETIKLKNWDSVIREDGQWTLEIVTSTPFGLDRLGYLTFDVERTISVRGNVTSLD